MAPTMEQLGRRVADRKASLLGKGLKVNTGKSKVMVGSSGGKIIVNSGKWPCGVCGKGVQANSIQCTVCKKWIHKQCSGVRSDIQSSPLEMKGRVYASCGRSSMTYGSETRPLLVDVGLKFERAEMQMIKWMCGISLKDRRTNEELRRLVGVEPITTFIRSGRLRWYGHVMRKGD